MLVDGDRFTRALYVALNVETSYKTLARYLSVPFDANVPITAYLDVVRELSRETAGAAAFLSYRCAAINPLGSGIGPPSAAALPTFAAAYDETFLEQCKLWDVPALSPEFTSASNGATPTFIAVGELSPLPATLWAQNLQRDRPNTTVITFPNLGGNIEFFGPRCYQDLLQQFVFDPTTQLDVGSCSEPPIDFVA